MSQASPLTAHPPPVLWKAGPDPCFKSTDSSRVRHLKQSEVRAVNSGKNGAEQGLGPGEAVFRGPQSPCTRGERGPEVCPATRPRAAREKLAGTLKTVKKVELPQQVLITNKQKPQCRGTEAFRRDGHVYYLDQECTLLPASTKQCTLIMFSI